MTEQWTAVSLHDAFDDVPDIASYPFRRDAIVVVKFAGPGLTLRVDGVEHDFAAEKHGEAWVMTFTSDDCYSELPALPEGALTLRDDRVLIGDRAEVFTSVPMSPSLRDWAWAWTPTVGPAELRVLVAADVAAIDAWFESRASRFYFYERTDKYWGRRFQSKLSADSILRMAAGEILFIRGYADPPARQLYADGALIHQLIDGALPVTGFDVIDGDYLVDCASGDSKESLAAYMHAPAELTHRSEHPWKQGLGHLVIDAQAAAGADAIEALINAATLPRHVSVEFTPGIDVDALATRMREKHPRLHWRWTEVFPHVKRSVVT